jgi:hypothetical protein
VDLCDQGAGRVTCVVSECSLKFVQCKCRKMQRDTGRSGISRLSSCRRRPVCVPINIEIIPGHEEGFKCSRYVSERQLFAGNWSLDLGTCLLVPLWEHDVHVLSRVSKRFLLLLFRRRGKGFGRFLEFLCYGSVSRVWSWRLTA